MPGGMGSGSPSAVPSMKGPPGVIRGFSSQLPLYHQQGVLVVSGTTTDAAGVAVGGVTIQLFDAVTNTVFATTTSDVNGSYTFVVTNGNQTFYLVGYKAGVGTIVINIFGTTDIVLPTAA